MAKSRFTKSFSFLSTVFVDNFVDNEEINYIQYRCKVYDLLNVALNALQFIFNNQPLTISPAASENALPIISTVKKIVHKSVFAYPYAAMKKPPSALGAILSAPG
jgi:hypothetical protein